MKEAPLRQAHREYFGGERREKRQPGEMAHCFKAKAQGVAVKGSRPEKGLSFYARERIIRAGLAAHEYASVEDMLALADKRGEPPFLIVADELNDPHNLGAILRTAECTGAHG